MKKIQRIICSTIVLCMLVSMLPAQTFAIEDNRLEEASSLTVSTQTLASDPGLPENEELFAAYAEQIFYGNNFSLLGTAAGERLSGNEKVLYDALVPILKQIANGERSSTVIGVGQTVTDNDGNTYIADVEVTFEGLDISISHVLTALESDMPFEMYWYANGADSKLTKVVSNSLTHLQLSLGVASAYQGASIYTVDTEKTGAAVAAAENAYAIVQEYEGCSDYNKLIGYRDAICNLVSYDYEAADTDSFHIDSNPWQLISVFDGNNDTNVVCAGYSRAFQYLCDLTTFENGTSCYSVCGYMNDEYHMWNIVSLDGKNYLADITNSDYSIVSACPVVNVFLVGGIGNISDGYIASEIVYTYDDNTKNLWGMGDESILVLADTDYIEKPDIYLDGDFEFDLQPKFAKLRKYNGIASDVVIPAMVNGLPVTIIEAGAFCDNDYIKSVTIPANIHTIESGKETDVFVRHEDAEYIPYDFLFSREGAFSKCDALNTVIFSPESQLSKLGDWAFYACPISNITLPSSIRSIGYSCFRDTNLKELIIPEGVEELGGAVVCGTKVTQLHLPSTCVSFKDYETRNLTSFTVAEGNPLFRAHEGVLYYNWGSLGWTLYSYPRGKTNNTYTVPDFCAAVYEASWSYNPYLQEINIKDCYYIFDLTGTKTKAEIIPSSTNPYVTNHGKMLFTKDMKTLINVPAILTETITLPDGVEIINPYAMWNCNMSAVILPDTVTTIEECAFSFCSRLETVRLSERLKTINPALFGECENLLYIVFPNGIETIPDSMFTGSQIRAVYIPASVKAIGDDAFNCRGPNEFGYGSVYYGGTESQWKSLNFDNQQFFRNEDTIFHYEAKIKIDDKLDYHLYEETIKSATCTESGYSTYRCSCGDTYTGSKVQPLGHNWECTETIIPETCTTGGEGVYTCSRCGITDTLNTDPLGHRNENGVCTVCGTAVIQITKQPVSVIVEEGETASVSVEVTGTDLTYTWYYKNSGSSVFYKTNAFSGNTYSVTMSEERNGRQIYCVISDRYGNSVTTDTVTLNMFAGSVEITQQPQSIYVAEGKTATVTVVAIGDGLTYAWYYKNPGSTIFSKTAAFSGNTYSVTMSAARAGRQIYCVVTNKYGTSVQSDTVTLNMTNSSIQIVEQPKDVAVFEGETAKVSLKATGEGLQYQWLFKNADSTTFAYTWAFTGDTYSVTMNQARSGRQVYCVVTDKFGNSVTSDTVTLRMRTAGIEITKQPENVTAADGETAEVMIEATGEGLKYVWYYKNRGRSEFSPSTSFHDCVYSVTMSAERDGRQVYCVITDYYGNSVTTDTVTLTMEKKVTFSGTCGENLQWIFDENTGRLSISGTGPMDDYKKISAMPWYELNVKEVVIEEGVTSIGDNAFSLFSTLISVEIPDTVTSIGTFAFYQCTALTEAVLSENLISIGLCAFCGCASLKEIMIPSGITKLESSVFKGCGITEIVIPQGVTSIKDGAFQECENLADVTIPEGVTQIYSKAFYHCPNLKSIVLPDTVKSIGHNIFAECANLTDVTLSKDLEKIESSAFAYCTKLTTLVIPENVATISPKVFYNSGIKTLYFKGLAPKNSNSSQPFLDGMTLTAYYPVGDSTWTKEVRESYGGNITWLQCCAGQHRFGGWEQTKAPTYVAAGTEQRDCKDCDWYEVRTVNALVCDAPVVQISSDTVSGKPKLIWTAVEGATSYRIYRSTSKTGTYSSYGNTTSTSYVDADAVAGTNYYYKVRTRIPGSEEYSDYSNVVNRVCDLAKPVVDISVNSTTGKPVVKWETVSGASKYRIYRSTEKSSGYELVYTAVSARTYTDTAAQAGTTYYYKVKATHSNSAANSAYSSVVSSLCDLAKPVVSITLSNGDPKISWEKISDAAKYEVYRATSKDGTYKKVKTTVTVTSYTDTTANSGTKYYYKVKAIHSNTDANSSYSSVKYITAE